VTAPGSGVDVLGMGVVASAGEVMVVGCGSADRFGRDGPADGSATLFRGDGWLAGTAFIPFIDPFAVVAWLAFSFSSVSSSSSASSASSSLLFFSLILRTPASLACLYLTYLKSRV